MVFLHLMQHVGGKLHVDGEQRQADHPDENRHEREQHQPGDKARIHPAVPEPVDDHRPPPAVPEALPCAPACGRI